MWIQRHAQVLRSYLGSGGYEVKVDGGINGNQQIGMIFERDPNNFLIFMLYGTDQVHAYIERFTFVGDVLHKKTFGTQPLGMPVPDSGPYYMRVGVEDNLNPTLRQWQFEWSRDGVVWTKLLSGVFEGALADENIGAIQRVGFFAGSHPTIFSPVSEAFDYFRSAVLQAPDNLLARPGNGRVDLAWSAVPRAQSYSVYASTGGSYSLVGTTTGTTFSQVGLPNGTLRKYVVIPTLGGLQGFTSQPVSAIPHAAAGVQTLPTQGLLLALSAAELAYIHNPGDLITKWTNASGPLIAASAPQLLAPSFVTSAINGQPAVRFNGIDDYLALPSGFSDFSAGLTLFVVMRPTTLQPSAKVLLLGNGTETSAGNIGLGRAGSTAGYQYFTSNSAGQYDWFESSSGMTAGEASLLALRQQPAAGGTHSYAEVFRNGVALAGKNVFVPPVGNRSLNYIAKSYWNEGVFQGDIAEILLYNRTLSTAEQNAVHAYIGQRYALSLSNMPLPPLLPAPTNLLANAGNAAVVLGWSPVTGATGYRILRANTQGGTPVQIADLSGTSYTDTSVTNGTTYYYQITAYNSVYGSPNSVQVSATPVAPPPPPPGISTTGLLLALNAENLLARISYNQPVLAWPDSSPQYNNALAGSGAPLLVSNSIGGRAAVRFDGIDDFLTLPSGFQDFTSGLTLFVVLRPSVLQPSSKIIQLGNGAGSANIGLGRAGSTAGYQYFTTNASGNFGWFDTSSGMVAGEASVLAVRQLPGTANSLSYAEIFKNGTPLLGQGVYVPPVMARGFNYIAKSYWSEGLFQGDIAEILLYNRVLSVAEQNAVHNYLAPRYGLTLSAMPPAPPLAAPANLLATAGNGTVSLSWSPVTLATGYRVYRSTSSGGTPVQIADISGTSYTNTPVTNGTTYYYVVSAYNAGQSSPNSTQVSARPYAPPSPPAGVPTSGLMLALNAENLLAVTSYGQPVTNWPDASSYRSNPTAAGSGAPTLVSNAIGGRPAVRFDGVNDFLALPGAYSNFTGGLTLFVVMRPTVLQPGAKVLLLGNGAGAANIGVGRAGTTSGYEYFTNNASGNYTTLPTTSGMVAGQASLLALRQQAGSVNSLSYAEIFQNGTALAGKAVYVPPVTTRSTNYIGKSYWGDGFFQGDVAEVLLYNRVLTTTEQNAVQSYIATRYGLTLGSMPPPPALAAPTNLVATAGNASVALSWNAVTGADGYRITRRTSPSGTPTQVADISGTSFTNTSLVNGTTYYYDVVAYGSTQATSQPSVQVSAKPYAPLAPPAGIPTSGLMLSLNAENLLAVSAYGQPVTSWPDASANRSNATAGANAPTLVSNAIGGRPAVRFDGVDDFLSLPGGFQDFTGGISLFVVLRPTAVQSGSKIVQLGNGAGAANIGLGRAGSSAGYQYYNTNASGSYDWFDTSSGLVTGESSLLTLRQQPGAVNGFSYAEVLKNGAALSGKSVFVPPVATRSVNYIGKSYWPDGLFQGDIAEVILYNRVLSTTEQNAVHAYITARYGIPLP